MSQAQTAAGTKIFIGNAMPEDLEDALDWEAVTWKEIGEVTDIPEFGKAYELITHNPLATRRTNKRKGSYNDGSMTLQMARVADDEGQMAMEAALDSDATFPFKIEENDAPEGGTPTTLYFGAQVLSYTRNYGTVNNIKQAAAQLEIDTDVLEVAAEEAA